MPNSTNSLQAILHHHKDPSFIIGMLQFQIYILVIFNVTTSKRKFLHGSVQSFEKLSTTHNSIACRTNFISDNLVIVHCMTSSVSHMDVEEFLPTLLYNAAQFIEVYRQLCLPWPSQHPDSCYSSNIHLDIFCSVWDHCPVA